MTTPRIIDDVCEIQSIGHATLHCWTHDVSFLREGPVPAPCEGRTWITPLRNRARLAGSHVMISPRPAVAVWRKQ